MTLSDWPAASFSFVPELGVAEELASSVASATLGQDWADLTQPCDLRKVCAVGRFTARRLDKRFANSPHDALLVPEADGAFTILVDPIPKSEKALNSDLARHRNRFRIAHEIAHSFFYDRAASPPRRVTPWTENEEAFCDEFASALLVPRRVIRKLPPAPSSVFSLSERFDVSVEVAARAVARVHSNLSIVGLLWQPHPSKPGRPNLRVTWSAGPRFIPRHATLHSDVVKRAAVDGEYIGVERLNAAALRGEFIVQAARLPKRRQMIVFLHPPTSSVDLPLGSMSAGAVTFAFSGWE